MSLHACGHVGGFLTCNIERIEFRRHADAKGSERHMDAVLMCTRHAVRCQCEREILVSRDSSAVIHPLVCRECHKSRKRGARAKKCCSGQRRRTACLRSCGPSSLRCMDHVYSCRIERSSSLVAGVAHMAPCMAQAGCRARSPDKFLLFSTNPCCAYQPLLQSRETGL